MEEDTQNPEPRCDFSAMEDEAGHNSDRYGYGVVGTALSGGCYAISLHFVTFASTLPSTGSGGPSIAPLLYFIFATLVTFVIGCLIALASAMFVFLMAAAFVYSLKIPVESKWIVAIAGGVYGVLPFVPTLVLQNQFSHREPLKSCSYVQRLQRQLPTARSEPHGSHRR